MNSITICNKVIEYSFYSLFFLVPLVFTSNTSELFEFNKMWVTFGLTIIIAASWTIKMVLQRKIIIQKTPFDIPILLFLTSQFISTIISLDPHVSWWGYYSRFNGGFLSLLSYVLLYYAFVSNFLSRHSHESISGAKFVKRILLVCLLSGTIVALWGLPAHFGYDPTCLIFRGSLDVACWTEAFQPKIRIFSTLGQPNWLAAYLAVLVPISIAFSLSLLQKISHHEKKYQVLGIKYYVSDKKIILNTCYFILTTIFYIDLIYTQSRSGIIGLASGIAVSIAAIALFFRSHIKTQAIIFISLTGGFIVLFSLFNGTPFNPKLTDFFAQSKTQTTPVIQGPALETGGTESGSIRKIVWQGAIDVWKSNPLIGSGVETFAFAYYQHRPAAHNLTSEWDYLYNKAHNEYLNYLATTGILGLGSYLLVIGWFLTYILNQVKTKRHSVPIDHAILILALVGSYISILVSNFFGFSIVIINLFFFLIPAFTLGLLKSDENNEHPPKPTPASLSVSAPQWMGIVIVCLVSFYMLGILIFAWFADTSYAYGSNLSKAGQYVLADPYLRNAVETSNEPVFKDELSYNKAVLSVLYAQEKDGTSAARLAREAVDISDAAIQNSPNNVVFWKTRVRLFYTLSQLDPEYLDLALQSIDHAIMLAPTDAKVWYTKGVLLGQNGQIDKGIEVLTKTILLKPNYRDAHYALGLFYREKAVNDSNTVVDPQSQKKAVEKMQYVLQNFDPKDKQVLDSLKSWNEPIPE